MTTSTVTYPPRPVVDRKELPPGPSELPVIGQTLRYIRDPIRFMQEAAGYGDLVTLSVKPALLLMVNHPDLIRDVVVTNHRLVGRGPNADVLKYAMGDGLVTAGPADHLQQRRLMQPQFHRGRIEGYGELMREYAAQHRTAWTDGQRVDMAQEMGALTLRIVVKTLFGLELPDDARRIGEAFELINNYLVARVNQPPKMRRLLHRLPVPYTVRFRRARAGTGPHHLGADHRAAGKIHGRRRFAFTAARRSSRGRRRCRAVAHRPAGARPDHHDVCCGA